MTKVINFLYPAKITHGASGKIVADAGSRPGRIITAVKQTRVRYNLFRNKYVILKIYNMKHFYLLFVVLLSVGANAQIVTTSPKIVQCSSVPITITFHADRGNKGLAGLTASTPVYAHTGVMLKGSEEWSHAPAWLDNSAKYKMTYVSANSWQLTIPSIKEYYGLTAGEEPVKLAFVFRNATGSKEGKTESGGDIFVEVAPDGFAMAMSALPEVTLLSEATAIDFTVNTSQAAKIELFVNSYESMPIATVSNGTELTKTYTISASGNTRILARAAAGTNTAEDAIEYCLAGNSPAKDYPGGVPKMGPVANGDGSVTFCVGAPGKTSMMIVGSWNGYVYNMSGRRINFDRRLPVGIYIVVVDGHAGKVVVR